MEIPERNRPMLQISFPADGYAVDAMKKFDRV